MEISPLTLNRLSVYLRCLRVLEAEGIDRVSSLELARRFHLSAAQIRKDLAQFGEFGIRGVGYETSKLAERLKGLLGLDRAHRMIIVGIGNLGSALVSSDGFNSDSFQVVAALDNDPAKIGRKVDGIRIQDAREMDKVVKSTEAEIGILTVPAEAAQSNYDNLVRAGVRAILNFAPARLKLTPDVHSKDVDLRIDLEELGYFLAGS